MMISGFSVATLTNSQLVTVKCDYDYMHTVEDKLRSRREGILFDSLVNQPYFCRGGEACSAH